jgi:hypothetical protein
MKSFDFYEFAGVVTPGALILYTVSLIVPGSAPFLMAKEISVGDLGLFVILAYVAGHIVQAIGNLIESVFWKPFGGMPTNWVLRHDQELLNEAQVNKLPDRVRSLLDIGINKPITDLSVKEWFPITRQIYAAVAGAERAHRVDTFNGNYGMFRGFASALLFASILNIATHWPAGWPTSLVLGAAALLALIRMHRFGKHYARELFVQFLQLDSREPG